MSDGAARQSSGSQLDDQTTGTDNTNDFGGAVFAICTSMAVIAAAIVLVPPHDEARAGIPVDVLAAAKPVTVLKTPYVTALKTPYVGGEVRSNASPTAAKLVAPAQDTGTLPVIKVAKRVEEFTPVKRALKAEKTFSKSKQFKRSRPKIGWKGSKESYTNKAHKSKRKVKVAALHSNRRNDANRARKKKRKSLTGGRKVHWAASSKCLNAHLRKIIYEVAVRFGKVRVNSTCRSKKHNRRVGGAPRSQHLTGSAVDFRVFGDYRGAWRYVRARSGIGGHKHYGGGLFHIDVGPRRTW